MNYSQLQEQHILRDKRYEKLISLGPEKLAYSLLELAIRNQPSKEILVNVFPLEEIILNL